MEHTLRTGLTVKLIPGPLPIDLDGCLNQDRIQPPSRGDEQAQSYRRRDIFIVEHEPSPLEDIATEPVLNLPMSSDMSGVS